MLAANRSLSPQNQGFTSIQFTGETAGIRLLNPLLAAHLTTDPDSVGPRSVGPGLDGDTGRMPRETGSLRATAYGSTNLAR